LGKKGTLSQSVSSSFCIHMMIYSIITTVNIASALMTTACDRA
jgi:hypothetical protein